LLKKEREKNREPESRKAKEPVINYNSIGSDDLKILRKKFNVLIVEDEEYNISMQKRILDEAGYKVTFATNGKYAFEVVKEKHFDLITMDVRMPDIDGVILTKEIRRLGNSNKETPILGISSLVLKEDSKKFILAGMNDLIFKPLVIRDYLDKIDKLLNIS